MSMPSLPLKRFAHPLGRIGVRKMRGYLPLSDASATGDEDHYLRSSPLEARFLPTAALALTARVRSLTFDFLPGCDCFLSNEAACPAVLCIA
jgi:hypothetical protein